MEKEKVTFADSLVLGAILKVVQKHWQSMNEWKDGEPAKLYCAAGKIGVEYASGNKWLYDLDNQNWIQD